MRERRGPLSRHRRGYGVSMGSKTACSGGGGMSSPRSVAVSNWVLSKMALAWVTTASVWSPSRTRPKPFAVESVFDTTATVHPVCATFSASLIVPDGPTVRYVDAGAPTGGDGTKAAPYRTIKEALTAAKAGWTVAIAGGTYQESLVMDEAVTLRGRCAAKVTLQGSGIAAIVVTSGTTAEAPARLERLRVTGPSLGLIVQSGGHLEALRVHVQAATEIGVKVTSVGSRALLRELVVADTQPRASDKDYGIGIQVRGGGSLVLTLARLTHNHVLGLQARDAGTKVVAEGLLVDGTLPQASSDKFGGGIEVGSKASVELACARLSGNREQGLHAINSGTKVRAVGVRVDDTRARVADGGGGRGLYVRDGADVVLTAARLSGNREVGLAATDDATTVTAMALVVDGTLARASDGGSGRGISVQNGASLVLAAAQVSTNRDAGLRVSGPNAQVRAAGLLVYGTQAQASDSQFGQGIYVRSGASLVLTSGRLSGNTEAGLFVEDGVTDGVTEVSATGLLVDDTRPRASDGEFGRGVGVQAGANLTLTSTRLSSNRTHGLFANGAGTVARAAGLLVDGTRSQASDGKYGYGVEVASGAEAALTSARLVGNTNAGLFAAGGGPEVPTQVRAAGLLVDGTVAGAEVGMGGPGIELHSGASLALSSTRLSGNRAVGLIAVDPGTAVHAAGLLVDGSLPLVADQAFGRGIEVQAGASLLLVSARLTGNTDIGLLAGGESADVGSTGVLVDDTTGNAMGFRGEGIFALDDAELRATSSLFAGNHSGGASFYQARGTLDGCVIRDTRVSMYEKPSGAIVQLADGVVALEAPSVSITQTTVCGNPGAGIVLRTCRGATVSHTLSTANGLGFVLDAEHDENVVTEANAIFGNSQTDTGTGLVREYAPPPEKAAAPASERQ